MLNGSETWPLTEKLSRKKKGLLEKSGKRSDEGRRNSYDCIT